MRDICARNIRNVSNVHHQQPRGYPRVYQDYQRLPSLHRSLSQRWEDRTRLVVTILPKVAGSTRLVVTILPKVAGRTRLVVPVSHPGIHRCYTPERYTLVVHPVTHPRGIPWWYTPCYTPERHTLVGIYTLLHTREAYPGGYTPLYTPERHTLVVYPLYIPERHTLVVTSLYTPERYILVVNSSYTREVYPGGKPPYTPERYTLVVNLLICLPPSHCRWYTSLYASLPGI